MESKENTYIQEEQEAEIEVSILIITAIVRE